MKIRKSSAVLVLLILFGISLTTALSNESIQAQNSLAQAEQDIQDMGAVDIPIGRVNETYQEAAQLYLAQQTLEVNRGRAKYGLILEYTAEIRDIKEVAIVANDELKIFKETFEDIHKDIGLSEMQEDYDEIVKSFSDERFEDTLVLINKGYERISEIQSSRTAVNAVYQATARTLKNFFIKYWIKMVIILVASLVLFFIFQKSLKRIMRRRKLKHLTFKKKAIDGLLKKIQGDYFKSRKISEGEYNIKLKKFKEIIRDIDRQLMVLNEDKFRSMKGSRELMSVGDRKKKGVKKKKVGNGNGNKI